MNRGDLLYFAQKGPISDITGSLIPEETWPETNEFYIWSEGVKQSVEFVVESKDKIDLYVERNRYHRLGHRMKDVGRGVSGSGWSQPF